jgi:lipooligosaccharide transport system ATP-binding protein
VPSAVAEPLIRARGLTKRFASFTAVDSIDFDVHPGEAFGFLGPNGAGKTSTMR